jgi:hypothetical protein
MTARQNQIYALAVALGELDLEGALLATGLRETPPSLTRTTNRAVNGSIGR